MVTKAIGPVVSHRLTHQATCHDCLWTVVTYDKPQRDRLATGHLVTCEAYIPTIAEVMQAGRDITAERTHA